jgi:hypothetical protein
MPVNLIIEIPCDPESLAEAAQVIENLRAIYPHLSPPPEGNDEPPAAPVPSPPPDVPQGPAPDPLAVASFVDAWLRHLGPGSRRFWRIAAEYALNRNCNITFDDLERASNISRESLRSYHRNSYRAIKNEGALDPMPGNWDAAFGRTTYAMLEVVRDRILELTRDDPPA